MIDFVGISVFNLYDPNLRLDFVSEMSRSPLS